MRGFAVVSATAFVDGSTPLRARMLPASQECRASVLVSIGDLGSSVLIYIEDRDRLIDLAGALTRAHGEWTALDTAPADETETGGPPPW